MKIQYHAIGGLAGGFFFCAGYHIPISLSHIGYVIQIPQYSKVLSIIFGLSILGSIFPDIDFQIQHFLNLKAFRWYSHRGIFHSILLTVIIGLVLFFYNPLYLPFAFGMFIHLIQDWTTPSGIPIFFSYKPRLIGGFITNDDIFKQTLFTVVILALSIATLHFL